MFHAAYAHEQVNAFSFYRHAPGRHIFPAFKSYNEFSLLVHLKAEYSINFRPKSLPQMTGIQPESFSMLC